MGQKWPFSVVKGLKQSLFRSNHNDSFITPCICDELKPTGTIKNEETLIRQAAVEQPPAALTTKPPFTTTLCLFMFSFFKFILTNLIPFQFSFREAYGWLELDLLSLPEFFVNFLGKGPIKIFLVFYSCISNFDLND